jgi:hypothetical protein
MSLVLTEGFDLFSAFPNGGWTSTGLTPTIVTGRITGTAAQVPVANSFVSGLTKPLSPNLTSIVVGFAWQMTTLGETALQRIVGLIESGSEQIGLRVNSAGRLLLTRGGTTVVTSTNVVVAINTWYYIELKIKFGSGVLGSYALRVNGSAVTGMPDVAATNTISTANSFINAINLVNGQSGEAGSNVQRFDDGYLLSNDAVGLTDFLGDCRVVSPLPNGAGSNTAFTKTGAQPTNWQSVNESTPDSDTTYVSSSTVGQVDTYAYANLPSSTSTVLAVVSRYFLRKDDAGARTVTTHVRSGGSEADATGSVAPSTTYAFAEQVMETNPVSSAAWTPADFNAAEFGPKIAA